MTIDQLRAAHAAGCRIQAWTLNPLDQLPAIAEVTSAHGYWRDLPQVTEPKFTCPAHLYRIHPEDLALLPTEPVAEDVVTRTAEHIERAVEYIEKVYPDAKMLDRGPILRNMRRWARQLRNTTPTEPAPDREDVERFAGPITDENAAERISQMLMDVADVCGMYPEAVADPRAWAALILYCDDVTADLRRYHWLTSDLPTSLESSRRLNILRWMHVNGKGAIDAAIDAARQEQA